MKTTSAAQIAANRANARKSTGPHDTSKTRFNAVNHGLLAQGITALDDPQEYAKLLEGVKAHYQPVGQLEDEFVRRVAKDLLFGQRALRFEAEQITAQMNPPITQTSPTEWGELLPGPRTEKIEVLDSGFSASLSPENIDQLLRTAVRYDRAIFNRLTGNLKQLSLIQKERRGREATAVKTN